MNKDPRKSQTKKNYTITTNDKKQYTIPAYNIEQAESFATKIKLKGTIQQTEEITPEKENIITHNFQKHAPTTNAETEIKSPRCPHA